MMHPLVSIPVQTYNSASTVVETLDSIYAQTYPRLELIVTDDASTDDTIAVCQKWIDEHKDRFERVEVVTTPKNTGLSANANRGEAACTGTWVKDVAGDDLLLPNCVEDCVQYVTEHPEIIALFGKFHAFGENPEYAREIENGWDYRVFSLSQEEQLKRLIHVGNSYPAITFFFNREEFNRLGIHNDERIPMIEDYPKWINCLRKGVQLHFMDKFIVNYRVGVGMSTQKRDGMSFYRSHRLITLLYLYPEWQKEKPEAAVQQLLEQECSIYQELLTAESEDATKIRHERDSYKQDVERLQRELNMVRGSKAYRLGRALLAPFKKK